MSASSIQESKKLLYDFFKHITTLSTGTVVILATFLEKVFQNPNWQGLIIVTFIGLLVSLMTALGSMFFMALHVRENLEGMDRAVAVTLITICFSGFTFAIISLSIFTVKNFLK